MEPMALGSPVGSPSGTPSSPTTSPFLPSFLMGDSTPNVSTPRANVPARQTSKHVTFGTTGLTMPPTHLSHSLSTPIGTSRPLQSVTSPPEKPASDFGPPTLGLFDTLSPLPGSAVPSHNNSTYLSTSGVFSPGVFSPSQPVINSPFFGPTTSPSQGSSNAPPAHLFVSESQKLQETTGNKESLSRGDIRNVKEGDQDTWVTVFGFLPNAVNDILAHFVHCGTILEHKWGGGGQGRGENVPQKCNWIHLRFRTAREARRAIAKNGKVFGECMMVGVIPCQDPEILHSQKENIQGPEATFPSQQKSSSTALSGIRPLGVDFTSPWKESPKAMSSSNRNPECTGIRPLMKMAMSPQNDKVEGVDASPPWPGISW